MNPIQKLLLEKLPVKLLQNILFLDDWVQPPDFLFLSNAERKKLMSKYQHGAKAPTEKNFWVWFGAYATKDRQPVFYNERVPRIIYECINGPLIWPGPGQKKRRLVNALTMYQSDVNIYKFIPAVGARYATFRKEMALDPSKDFMAINLCQLSLLDNKLINDGIVFLEEHFEDFRNEQERRLALTALAYAPHIQNKIMEYFKEKYDELQSDHNSTGITQSSETVDELSDHRANDFNSTEDESITDTASSDIDPNVSEGT